ncbi:uncharacterized protein C8Q71DRAFT_516088 [Rhodofomes roseus]|uniref:Uncharacterized protein n=1 Tax=Rhodofomes roseus TaxID=34475 RepID=A0ABQ8KMS7_9APHY|nr:uncharacterized protein C8Q71DRAFT_516088 [Rhodofomes roseus]KAH9839521.1 hypothetical protein C8Q71DRAFT_516088 [Rhodofomes roseus]
MSRCSARVSSFPKSLTEHWSTQHGYAAAMVQVKPRYRGSNCCGCPLRYGWSSTGCGKQGGSVEVGGCHRRAQTNSDMIAMSLPAARYPLRAATDSLLSRDVLVCLRRSRISVPALIAAWSLHVFSSRGPRVMILCCSSMCTVQSQSQQTILSVKVAASPKFIVFRPFICANPELCEHRWRRVAGGGCSLPRATWWQLWRGSPAPRPET